MVWTNAMWMFLISIIELSYLVCMCIRVILFCATYSVRSFYSSIEPVLLSSIAAKVTPNATWWQRWDAGSVPLQPPQQIPKKPCRWVGIMETKVRIVPHARVSWKAGHGPTRTRTRTRADSDTDTENRGKGRHRIKCWVYDPCTWLATETLDERLRNCSCISKGNSG